MSCNYSDCENLNIEKNLKPKMLVIERRNLSGPLVDILHFLRINCIQTIYNKNFAQLFYSLSW